MKLTTFILLVFSMHVSAVSYSQNVTLSEKNVSLQKIFQQINKQVNYSFLYTDELLQKTNKVTIEATNAPLETVLKECFANQPFTYQIFDRTIVLKPKIITSTSMAATPPDVITGTVVDEAGITMPGVTIKLQGTSAATVTDVNGAYRLSLPDGVKTGILSFSFIGYKTQDVPLGTSLVLNVKLEPESKSLNEVVVVGYNTIKKSDVTGAVISVTEEDIRSRPVANALEAMQGKAAGVDIQSTQRPGTVGSIQIRGQRSLNASRDPLYVVDGVPLAAGGIDAINPNDIQNIDVLKDASATAVYGSRGANGVIIVTTKRGKAGAMSLSYTGTTTIEKLYDRTDMMNSEQYINFRRDAFRRINYVNTFNGKTTPVGTGYPDIPTQADDQRIFAGDAVALANINKGWNNGVFDGSLVPTTNWTSYERKTGVTQNHTISASGGTDKLKAYGSFGYLYQDGTQPGMSYERYTSNLSVDITPTKWFSMGGSVNVTYSYNNYGFTNTSPSGGGTLYSLAQGMLPYAVPFDPATGNRINLPGGDVNIVNPIGDEDNNTVQRRLLRTLGSLYAEINILPGLKYRMNFGPDFADNNNGQYETANSFNRGGGQPGSTSYASLSQGNRLAFTLDNLLYYNKTIDKHDFGLTLLQSTSGNRTSSSSMTAINLPYDKQLWYQLNSVSALNSFGSDLTESSLESYMARFNYTFNNKYLLTASARWDGASQLAPGHKWDFFPSVALAWRIDQEEYIKNITWIDQLKVRLGAGTTGNAAIDPYSTEGRLQALYYTFGSSVQAGYVASDASLASPIPLPNPNLGWEHTTQYNLGFDFSFLKGRIGGVIDVYTSRTSDLLMLRTIPSVLGYTTAYDNVGVTANNGIDITLNTINLKKKNFSWSTSVNFSANKDRIVSLANGKSDDVNNRWFIGQRISVFYDYQKVGIWQNTPADLAEMALYAANRPDGTKGQIFVPGSIKVKDLNNDHKIDANNDMSVVGHSSPDWVGGMTNTFDYKNFEFSFFLYARWGYTIRAGAESEQGRYAQRVIDYWTPTHPTNAYPAPNYSSATGDPYINTMNYQDGSYIALRNVSLGYFLPNTLSKKLGVSRVKVYAQASNPTLLYSRISWLNPDLNASFYNRGLVFGINVGF